MEAWDPIAFSFLCCKICAVIGMNFIYIFITDGSAPTDELAKEAVE
jgi:hypothetical protein